MKPSPTPAISTFSKPDHHPFGMIMPDRSQSAGGGYRYGFNGKEKDDEVKASGNQIDYGMRVHDPRLGRFLSVDPLTRFYPMLTPYQYASNSPITFIDLDGLEAVHPDRVRNVNDVQIKTVTSKTINENPTMGTMYETTYSTHVISHVYNGKSTSVTFDQVEGFRSPKSRINMAAQGTFMIGPFDTYRAGQFSNEMRAIIAPRFSQWLQENRGLEQEEANNYAKVFRHIAWQGRLAAEFGEEFANELGQFYENYSPNTQGDGNISFRDLVNNEYGRQFGINYARENPNFWETGEGMERFYQAAQEYVIQSFPELQQPETNEQDQ